MDTAEALRLRRVLEVVGLPAALLVVQAVLLPMPAGVYVQGLTLGLLGAVVSVGLCLLYRANRIISFAQSALGLVPTVVAVDLIVYSGWGFVGAGLAGAALAVVLGAALHVLLIRRFARASRLVLTVASIGVAQACLAVSLEVPRLWGKTTRAEQITTGWNVDITIDPLLFHAEHLLAWVVAPTVLALVAVLLLRTRTGAAVRAAADRPDRAALLGIPVNRIQLLVWSGAALLSFVGVFLRVAITGLPFASTESFTALLAALAALTLGRFTHVVRVAAASIALGVVEQAITWNHPENPDLYGVVLAVVIAVGLALAARPRTRLDRDTTSAWLEDGQARRLPATLARRPGIRTIRWAGGLGLLAAAIDLPSHLGSGDQLKAATVVVFAIVGVSLVILTGWAGQVSLGQMGFVAVGAAVGAWTTQTQDQDLAVGLLAAAGAGGVAALAVGLPALRLRGLSLAVVTLAFNVATASYLLAPDDADWIPGDRVRRGQVLGVDLTTERRMYWLCLAVLVAVLWAAHAVRTSRPGRAMVAQRDNELAAEARGTSTARTRLTAFALSGAIAATAGCLLVHLLQSYPDQLLTPDRSISTFGATVVGGIGSPIGAALGALLFVGSGWFFGETARVLSTAIGLLLVLVLMPSGLAGALGTLRDRLLRRVLGTSSDRPPAAPDDPDDAPPRALPEAVHPRPRTGSDTAAPALRVRGLQVRIGSTVVVEDVSFDLESGQTLALLGTNGAGKSTVLNAISGLLPTTAGSIELDGVSVTGQRAHRIAALGLVQAPGGRGTFPSLTVAEHLTLAGWTHPRHDAGVRDRTEAALEAFPALRARWSEHAGDLSGGEQQMLVLAMASVTAPSVLLIDELALGLAPIVVSQLVAFLDRMRATGTSIVVVEQSPAAAAGLTDTAIFLDQGRVVLAGRVTDVLERPDVAHAVYLASASGRPDLPPLVAAGTTDRPRALAALGVSVSYGGVRALTDVDLDVARGEIVGLIGPNGAGKSTLLDALSGLVPHATGHVLVGDRDVTSTPFHRRAALGLGRSFQDARLFPSLTVEETLAMACDRSLAHPGLTDAVLRTPAHRQGEAAVRHRVDELLARFNLGDLREARTGEISTGQRRIVDLAVLLADGPDIVILDEPSSGLAQAEVQALGGLLRRLRQDLDLTMVIVEHDIPLISSIASRLIVLDQGRIIADGPSNTVLVDDRVIASYLGR